MSVELHPRRGARAPERAAREHATLKTRTLTLMASDTRPGEPANHGDGVHLNLNFDDPDEQAAVWDRLGAGAEITMPLGEQFFGRFGMLTDKFGVHWMLHYAPAED